jgi:hypothetical protein
MFAVLALSFVVGQSPMEKAPTAADTLRKIQADLKEARGLLKNVTDKATREKLELLITRSELAAAELAKTIPEKAAVLGDAEFAKLLTSLKSNSFDDGKLKFVQTLGARPRFSSAQAKQMLATFSFDRERVPAAVLLHKIVIDPENFFQALEAFSFKSSKDEVMEAIKPKK